MVSTAISTRDANESEAAVIAAAFVLPEAMQGLSSRLKADDFRLPLHAQTWGLMLSICGRGHDINPLSLADEAKSRGLQADYPAKTIAELMEPVGSPQLWRYHADQVQDAAKRRKLLYMLNEISGRATVDDDLTGLLAELQERTKGIAERGEAKDRFSVYSSAELAAADFTTTFLIEDVLVENESAIIGGSKKSLKTTLAIAMAISLATGYPFLGKFPVRHRRRTALISGESGRGTIQETARRIADSMGFTLADVEDALWSFDLPRLTSPGEMIHLRNFIKKHSVQVLFLDPAYLSLGITGDESRNLFAMGDVLGPLTAMATEMGVTLVLLHHLRKRQKMDGYEIPELDDLSGSGFSEWARQWILVGRREPYDAEKTGQHKLWLNAGGSAGHSTAWALDVEEGSIHDPGGRRWQTHLTAPSGVRADAAKEKLNAKQRKVDQQREADQAAVLRVLEQRSDGDTLRAIEKAARISRSRAEAAIEDLITLGSVEPADVVKNSRLESGYRMVPVDLSAVLDSFDSDGATGAIAPFRSTGSGAVLRTNGMEYRS